MTSHLQQPQRTMWLALSVLLCIFAFVPFTQAGPWQEIEGDIARTSNTPLVAKPPKAAWTAVDNNPLHRQCSFIFGPGNSLITDNNWIYLLGASIATYSLNGTSLWNWECDCALQDLVATEDTIIATTFSVNFTRQCALGIDAFSGQTLWNASTLGVGQALQTIIDPKDSQPIISDGRTAYKLNRRTGNIIWSNLNLNCQEIELSLGLGTFYCGFYATPGPFTGFSLSQYSLATGQLIWEARPGAVNKSNIDYSWPPMAIGGLTDRGYTLFDNGNFNSIMAVSAKDGSLLWHVPCPPTLSIDSNYAHVYNYKGRDYVMIYIVENFPSSSGRIGFICMDGATGKLVWTSFLSTFGQTYFAEPSLDPTGTLWVAMNDLSSEKLVGLAAIDAVTGTARKYPSPVTTGNPASFSALGTIGTAVGVGCFESQFSAFLLPSK